MNKETYKMTGEEWMKWLRVFKPHQTNDYNEYTPICECPKCRDGMITNSMEMFD